MKVSERGTILLAFAAFGAMIGTNVGAFPVIIKNAGLSLWLFGLIGAVGMLANIAMMAIGGFINRHADHRTVLLWIMPISFACLIFAQLAFSPLSFVVAAIFISMSLGTMDLFMNAEGAAIEQKFERSIFSAYHGSASLMMGVFAIISSIVSVSMAPWFVVLFTAIPMALAYGAIYVNIPHGTVVRREETEGSKPLPYKLLTFVGLAAGFGVTSEVACVQWAGQLLNSVAPSLAAYSGLGLAFYGLCSGVMRMFSDRIRAHYGDRSVMVTCLSIGIMGFAILSLELGFAISVLAFAAVGIGLSVVFPCLFALAAQLAPERKAAAMGYFAMVGGTPRVVLPWVLGAVAQIYGLSSVFVVTAIVSATALLIILATFTKVNEAMVSTNSTPA
jgi:MFS family permease